ncbi:MAG: hypothetical protein KGI58_02550 [Patescibacteria group bacterium]|nr:hypothetical protein [Patescibacteria group bacterium]
MKIDKEQFNISLQSFKDIRLSEKAKARIKSELIEHTNNSNGHSIPSPYSNIITSFLFKPVVIALILVFLISGGVAFASQASLPGDFLYPVKTNITEPLIKLTKLDNKAKASFELELVDRRISEMQKLSKENKVTEEKTKENFALLESNIKQYKHYESNTKQEDSYDKRASDINVRLNDYKNIISSAPETTPPTNVYSNVLEKIPSLSLPTKNSNEKNDKEKKRQEPTNKLETKIIHNEDTSHEATIHNNTNENNLNIDTKNNVDIDTKSTLPEEVIPGIIKSTNPKDLSL